MKRLGQPVLVAIVLALGIAVLASSPASAAVALDSTYGTGGKVVTSFGQESGLKDSVLQSDGKIVTVGFASNGSNADWAIVRYNTNGSLDTSFGTSGKVLRNFGGNDYAVTVKKQADGKLLVGGQARDASDTLVWTLSRYNINGTLDTSFGTGGTVTSFETQAASLQAIAVQADGKILATGYLNNGASNPSDDAILTRYNADGTIDTGFGTDGFVQNGYVYFGFVTDDRPKSVAVQADGTIYVYCDYDYHNFPNDQLAVLKYNASGALDTTFGNLDGGSGNGRTIREAGQQNEAGEMALQPDGKIVIVGDASSGEGSNSIFAARINPDGTRDQTFGEGTGGQAAYGLDEGLKGTFHSLVLRPDGKIVISGTLRASDGNLNFMVWQFTTAGKPDAAGIRAPFGYQAFPVGTGADDGQSIELQADGKVILAGNTATGSRTDWGLIRLGIPFAQRQLTSLAPMQAWLGIPNNQSAGLSVKPYVEVTHNGHLVANGYGSVVTLTRPGALQSVLTSTAFDEPWPAYDFEPGAELAVTLYTRQDCAIGGPTNGSVDLWFNGLLNNNSRFGVTLGGVNKTYYLRNNFTLAEQAGLLRQKINVPQPSSNCGLHMEPPYIPFGTWKIVP